MCHVVVVSALKAIAITEEQIVELNEWEFQLQRLARCPKIHDKILEGKYEVVFGRQKCGRGRIGFQSLRLQNWRTTWSYLFEFPQLELSSIFSTPLPIPVILGFLGWLFTLCKDNLFLARNSPRKLSGSGKDALKELFASLFPVLTGNLKIPWFTIVLLQNYCKNWQFAGAFLTRTFWFWVGLIQANFILRK